MASTTTGSADTELILKTIAPRAPQHMLARPRLSGTDASLLDRQIVLVQAAAGYGKTSLLAQWRSEHLAHGAAVAWWSADERDEPVRLLAGLVHAVRTACARPAFGRLLLDGGAASLREFEGITAWLAEIAQLSLDIVLMVDEAERLPEGGVAALTYVLRNAPQNLRVVVAARRGIDHAIEDLIAYGQCAVVGSDALRFRFEETLALVQGRFGSRIDADSCARLFELTDGWPLGLQLAMAAMARAPDARQMIGTMVAGGQGLRDQLVSLLLAKLTPEDEAFLIRVCIVDMLHPELCEALTDQPDTALHLARLVRETPVFITSENAEWCRMHTLVRDALRAQFSLLPEHERATLHDRAVTWLAAHDMIEEAARHALAAGNHAAAYDLAEHCLHDAVTQGRISAALEWLDVLPEQELERRPRLRLAAAWSLALGERHQEAEHQVERILARPDNDDRMRYECALIRSAAAYYADEIDRLMAIFEPWTDFVPEGAPWLRQVHANRMAARAIWLGEPAQARRIEQAVPRGDVDKARAYVVRWGDHIIGLSYLWEGQHRLAHDVLAPALASAEADLGRRHPLACMFAAMCASLAYEADRIDEASALLANRLDVLEHGGTPEILMLAYRTAARIAVVQGNEHRALDLLEAMHAMGMTRNLPRLRIASLSEQVRVHAARYRVQTCEHLVHQIDEIFSSEGAQRGPLWRQSALLMCALAHAGSAISSQHWQQALDPLGVAGELADALKLGRYRIETMALRALALEQTGGQGRALLLEAMNLAQTFGLTRTLADAHPALADWVRRVIDEEAVAGHAAHDIAPPHIVRVPTRDAASRPRVLPSVVLTPKERDILELLARNLSNKEIALTMSVGEETVKWHLKNLFGKLDAASRKHAVRRAMVLGLIEGGNA